MTTVFRLTVDAGPHDRAYCPVSIDLPLNYDKNTGVLLTDAKSGKTIPCQVTPHRNGATLTWLATGLKAGETRKLTAKPVSGAPAAPAVRIEDNPDDAVVTVSVFGKPFTAYNYGRKWVRPFLYPVIGPGGAQVTGGRVQSFTAYSATGSTVAQLAAEEDAGLRLMRILADQIVARLIAASASLP